MLVLWFLLFLSWPVAEIAIFIEVSRVIGWVGTILLTIVTAVAGTYLLRVQGVATMNRFLQSAEQGASPVGAVLDGMGIFAAGILLVLPGFISDVVGLLLFIPPLRRWLIGWLFRHMPEAARRPQPGPRGGQTEPPKSGFRKSDNVVDAEFETLEPEAKRIDTPSAPGSDGDTKPKADPNSPWRGRR